MKKNQKLIIVSSVAILLTLAVLVLVGAEWLRHPSHHESNELVDVSWRSGATPTYLQVTVRDSGGLPIPGVLVDSVSYSGRAGSTNVTDETGSVTLRPGEQELIGLLVNGVTVFDRDTPVSPSVGQGIEVTVIVKDPLRLKIKTESN